jgi:RNA polymerase sigma-70 factor, ECF subfamily
MPEHDTVEDSTLMLQVARGDKDALCKLMDKWEAPLGGFIFRYVQNREATCDLVQETFVRMYDARARYNGDMHFSSWIFKIASNLCKNYYRWRSRHVEDTVWDEECENCATPATSTVREEADPALAAVCTEDVTRIKQAVAAMPHQLKAALLLYYYQDLSYKEIAAALGCSERCIETRLYRAKAWLGKYFENCGDAPVPQRSQGTVLLT